LIATHEGRYVQEVFDLEVKFVKNEKLMETIEKDLEKNYKFLQFYQEKKWLNLFDVEQNFLSSYIKQLYPNQNPAQGFLEIVNLILDLDKKINVRDPVLDKSGKPVLIGKGEIVLDEYNEPVLDNHQKPVLKLGTILYKKDDPIEFAKILKPVLADPILKKLYENFIKTDTIHEKYCKKQYLLFLINMKNEIKFRIKKEKFLINQCTGNKEVDVSKNFLAKVIKQTGWFRANASFYTWCCTGQRQFIEGAVGYFSGSDPTATVIVETLEMFEASKKKNKRKKIINKYNLLNVLTKIVKKML